MSCSGGKTVLYDTVLRRVCVAVAVAEAGLAVACVAVAQAGLTVALRWHALRCLAVACLADDVFSDDWLCLFFFNFESF